MIVGLTQILIFQGLGEVCSKVLLPTIPGPVIGLVFLLLFLFVRKNVNQHLKLVSETFTQHLGLLFIPAAVGTVLYLPALKANAIAIICALIGSLVLTFVVSIGAFKILNKTDF